MTAPPRTYTFEDVHFDFDRYSLRPEATRVLDEAVTAMREDATLRLTIEGHTCNIGTAEYNLALGDRRANAVRDYLTSRGVAADRLQTVSYGEERPKYDNAREETRRLNRRAAWWSGCSRLESAIGNSESGIRNGRSAFRRSGRSCDS